MVTGFPRGSGWFTPRSFITISVAQVRSTFRVTTSFTGRPALAVTAAGTKPSLVTSMAMVWEAALGAAWATGAKPRARTRTAAGNRIRGMKVFGWGVAWAVSMARAAGERLMAAVEDQMVG